MSHFDGLSSGEVVAAGLGASWATRARGMDAAKAKVITQLTDFETRENMRFSSAMVLNGH
jgi:hypothetical protein